MALNEDDFESPGYEYLRSYQSMDNLYHKLIALSYQIDFCSRYKCPLIHRHYFSLPSKNAGEQQFLFTCLCAWLIKDKCQMNLELEPEDYRDLDTTIEIILEALRLLLTPDGDTHVKATSSIRFPASRLKQGFGPEVIWTMNILADRALELMLDSTPNMGKVSIIYNNKGPSDSNRQTFGTHIVIGQPVVGGGLTTRPLGSYQIDDTSLVFDKGEEETYQESDAKMIDTNEAYEDWYPQVDRARTYLEKVDWSDSKGEFEDWKDYLTAFRAFSQDIDGFLVPSKSMLNSVAHRIDRQLQTIIGHEKSIQTNLNSYIGGFLEIWRNYSLQEKHNQSLLAQVDAKTSEFEGFSKTIKSINGHIEARIKELNDGGKLRELEQIIDKLNGENRSFNVKIGLLLTTYARIHTKIVSLQS